MPTEIHQDNESRSNLTISIFDVIAFPEEVEELIEKAASGLGGRIKVTTGSKDFELFEYGVTQECQDSIQAFGKTCASGVHDKLRTRGEEISERESGEKRIVQALELVIGWLSVRENQMVILLPLRTRKDMIKDMSKGLKLRLRKGEEKVVCAERALSTREGILVHGSASYRLEPPIRFIAIPRNKRLKAPTECGSANQNVP